MTIGSVTGTNSNVQAERLGMTMQTDSVIKNIQNQIANAQKRLQELSSNEEMTLEEKMKKRQKIQQEITTLNQQLRQYQIQQRKEQQSKGTSMDDMLGGNREVKKEESGLSQASMQAMILADSSVKQAKVQGSTAAQMEGKAGVLESEIEMDKGRGTATEKKEEELADMQAKAQAAASAQISTLSDADKAMEEAAKADGLTEGEDSPDSEVAAVSAEENNTAEASAAQTVQTASYTPIDVRL